MSDDCNYNVYMINHFYQPFNVKFMVVKENGNAMTSVSLTPKVLKIILFGPIMPIQAKNVTKDWVDTISIPNGCSFIQQNVTYDN